MKTINIKDICKNFNVNEELLSDQFMSFFNSLDMSYEDLTPTEYDDLILEILNKLQTDKQVIGSPERTKIWHDGWKENLDDFLLNKGHNRLVPKFIRPNKIVRYNGKFIKPVNPYFERDFAKLIQIFCYDEFIKKQNVENVYEFGCGSSFNLLNIHDLSAKDNLKLNFYGSDFVESSADLVNEIAAHFKINFKGDLFNMIEPNYNYEIKPNSSVFTFGAIEQLDSKFKNFINYLLFQKPNVCFHIEPTVENYNENDLFDYLQIKFHKKRGYTQGLVPYLEDLKNKGKIEILKKQRINFGSKFMEGYHLFVWKVK